MCLNLNPHTDVSPDLSWLDLVRDGQDVTLISATTHTFRVPKMGGGGDTYGDCGGDGVINVVFIVTI